MAPATTTDIRRLRQVPSASYGVLQQQLAASAIEEAVEQVRCLGYAVFDPGYSEIEIQKLATDFDRIRAGYVEELGEVHLRKMGEFHTVRLMLAQGEQEFLGLALNRNLLAVLQKLIAGKFILNQQNGIINPPQEKYNQGSWHRDLPYQHFVSSRPLAINALFCIDDFTVENGATFVLPASQKSEDFPSTGYIEKNALQISAKAGSFILLDCMLFHSGGFNHSQKVRRAVNHVYNIPYFKQQINIPASMRNAAALSMEAKDVLGFNYLEPASLSRYFAQRMDRA